MPTPSTSGRLNIPPVNPQGTKKVSGEGLNQVPNYLFVSHLRGREHYVNHAGATATKAVGIDTMTQDNLEDQTAESESRDSFG